MKQAPIVSVICLCFNQAEFVLEAIHSVLEQTYDKVELIVVDDFSTDDSHEIIKRFTTENSEVKAIFLNENHGNCRAFNLGWRQAKGKYIIDLAGDDVLHPERIQVGVHELERLGDDYGVHYCDARIIDRMGKELAIHDTTRYYNPVPEGYIFEQLLEKYFINPVSMMLSNRLLEDLGGYDETLSYEDFDLWIRSSKAFKYCYSPEVLVSRRKVSGSHSTNQYRIGSKMLKSTYQVCLKAFEICESKNEYVALEKRVNYEMRKSLQALNPKIGQKYLSLKLKIKQRIKEES